MGRNPSFCVATKVIRRSLLCPFWSPWISLHSFPRIAKREIGNAVKLGLGAWLPNLRFFSSIFNPGPKVLAITRSYVVSSQVVICRNTMQQRQCLATLPLVLPCGVSICYKSTAASRWHSGACDWRNVHASFRLCGRAVEIPDACVGESPAKQHDLSLRSFSIEGHKGYQSGTMIAAFCCAAALGVPSSICDLVCAAALLHTTSKDDSIHLTVVDKTCFCFRGPRNHKHFVSAACKTGTNVLPISFVDSPPNKPNNLGMD